MLAEEQTKNRRHPGRLPKLSTMSPEQRDRHFEQLRVRDRVNKVKERRASQRMTKCNWWCHLAVILPILREVSRIGPR